MKKKLTLLLGILILSLGVTGVKAQFTETDTFNIYDKCNVQSYDFRYYGDDNIYKYISKNPGNSEDSGVAPEQTYYWHAPLSVMHYRYNHNNNTPYVTYCLDPDAGWSKNLKFDHYLGSIEEAKDREIGLLTILREGYFKKNTNTLWEDDNQYFDREKSVAYVATVVALRAWNMGCCDNSIGSEREEQKSAYINLGVDWAEELDVDSKTCPRLNKGHYTFPKFMFEVINDTDQRILFGNPERYKPNSCKTSCNKANKKYSLKYFKYGDSCSCDQISFGSYTKTKNHYSYKWKRRNNEGINQNQQDLLDPEYKYADNIYTEAKRLFTAAVEAVKNKDTNNSTSVNHYERVGNDYIEIKFEVENASEDTKLKIGNINCKSCATKGIKILAPEYYKDGKWHASSLPENLMEISENSLIQIRYKIDKTYCTDSANFEIEYTFTDPSYNRGALLKKNDDNQIDEPGANQVYQRFLIITEDGSGIINGKIPCISIDHCPTEIKPPVCVEPTDVSQKGPGKIVAPKDIKKCILDNRDDAKNSYQLGIDNDGVSNKYCKVFCKEDYDLIHLNPIIHDVTCGGSFQLKASINGQKDCYTSGTTFEKAIDFAQFRNDLINAQEQMVKNYNEYMLAYTAIKMNKLYVKLDNLLDYIINDKEIALLITPKSDKRSYKSKEDAERQKQLAFKQLQNAYKDFINAISDYNACTTIWKNNFKFNQKIEWEYTEARYEGIGQRAELKHTYYDVMSRFGKDEYRYMEPVVGTYKEDMEIEVCTENVNNKYECLNGKFITEESISGFKGNYNYDSDYDKVFNHYLSSNKYNFMYIQDIKDIVGQNDHHSFENVPISRAKFIRKTVKKKQEYISPSIYYQIPYLGKIAIVKDATDPKYLQYELLDHRLPVSPLLVGGGLFWLKISDLGEFYDTGELGRLIDHKGEHEKESVAYAKGKDDSIPDEEKFDGNYICKYDSQCRPKDCPTCDFECTLENGGGECIFKECPECAIGCVNCLFNLDDLQLHFKTISTTNFDGNDRKYGYNWDIITDMANFALIKEKAEETIKEIKEKNEQIYDPNYDPNQKPTDESNLVFSIKLTPKLIKKIKSHNDKINRKKVGGYANSSLTCYDFVKEDGTIYKSIFCYSDYIDELVKNYNDLVISKRNNEFLTRKNNPNKFGYWTLWPNYEYKEGVIGGPAWK